MLEEKAREKLWKYCPPALVWGVCILKLFQANIADWHVSESYYISSEVIIVFLAFLLWVGFFTAFGFWYKASPRFYRDELYSSVRGARSYLMSFDSQLITSKEWRDWTDGLVERELDVPVGKQRETFVQIKNKSNKCWQFAVYRERVGMSSEDKIDSFIEDTESMFPLIEKFIAQTEWVDKK